MSRPCFPRCALSQDARRLPGEWADDDRRCPQAAIAKITAEVGRNRPGNWERYVTFSEEIPVLLENWYSSRGIVALHLQRYEIKENYCQPHPQAARQLPHIRSRRHNRHRDLWHE